jgi:LuxR family maltose regulon positive regulatory protein
VSRFVAEFSGSDRYVLDYLTEEVLDGQPRELTTFLMESSVLDRLSGPLCDAVLGRSDSQELLESVERANLFLLPLDGERRWWRYHHLFADLLRARLRRTDPDRVPVLHHAAASWSERHDLPDDAIRHALAAGDADGAARIVEEHLEEQLWRRNEGATLARWLTALPPEALRRRPRLVFGQAIVGVLSGRLDEVESLLGAVERAGPAPPYRPSIGRRSSILSNLDACVALCRADLAWARGELEHAAEFAGAALTRSGEADELHARWPARCWPRPTGWPGGWSRPSGSSRRSSAGGRHRTSGSSCSASASTSAACSLLRAGSDRRCAPTAHSAPGARRRHLNSRECRGWALQWCSSPATS